MTNTQRKEIPRYVLPAVGGLFMTYLYNVVDGIFVGQGVGAAALGAVNIGVPFITSVVAVAAMFPMGGATVVAIRMGRGDKKGANQAFMTSVVLTLLVSAILTVVGVIFAESIVDLSGGAQLSREMRDMAVDYLFYYSAFSIPMLMSTCLSTFVRNDGSPALSFLGMAVGAVANIFMDWLFIFPFQMGVIGAAVASGLGQIAAVLVLLTHFLRKRGSLRLGGFHPSASLMGKICKRGVPEAVSQLNTPVTAFCYNLVLADLVGGMGVSPFSVLSFIYSLANAILSGVAQGLQPLWGNHYGQKDTGGLKSLLRDGIAINTVLAVLVYGVLFLLATPIICIFNQEPALVEAASKALPLFALSFIPMALNLIFTAYFYSTKRTVQADVIAVSRGIVVKAVCIFLMPSMLGEGVIWLAPLAAEGITLVLSILFNRCSQLAYR